MIYTGILLVLTAIAAFNRAARPYAFVLAYVWILTAVIEGMGLLRHVHLIDGIGWSMIAMLNLNRKTWWGSSCLGLATVTLATHAIAWAGFYSFGLWYGYEYSSALRTLFLIQMFVLVWGGYDVGQRMADYFADRRYGHGLPSGHRGLARRRGASSSEKAR